MKQTLAMGVLFGVVLAHAAVGFFGWQAMLDHIGEPPQQEIIIRVITASFEVAPEEPPFTSPIQTF